MKTKKTYTQMLTNDNFIVRDHLVHDVHTLPGVALLDMIYRLSEKYLGTSLIELQHILFLQPIVTSERFDRKIFVTFKPHESYWKVNVTSQKIKHGTDKEMSFDDNMECILRLRQHEPSGSPKLDIESFINDCDHQWDMDEIYDLVRNVDIKHYNFMKTIGTVYQRNNQEIMELNISELAKAYTNMFYAHVAFLDGASLAGLSFAKSQTQNWINSDNIPYMPISIERFCIYQKLPKTIYTYTEEKEAVGEKPINPDMISREITVLNEFGEVLIEFKKFSFKRIREPHLIKQLIKEEIEIPIHNEVIPWIESSDSHDSKTDLEFIEYELQGEIAKRLDTTPQKIGRREGFYELGLDSIQLLGIVKELENKVGETLYPTLLFEYSTIEKLSLFLHANYKHAFLRMAEQKQESDKTELDTDGNKKNVEAFLKKEIAKVLGLHINEIRVTEGFYELGLDSIHLLGIVKVLEQQVNATLYPTLLFEYSTIKQLTDYLSVNYPSAFLDWDRSLIESADHTNNTQAQKLFYEILWKKEDLRERNSAKGRSPYHVVIYYDSYFNPKSALYNPSMFDEVIQFDSELLNEVDQLQDKFNQLLTLFQGYLEDKQKTEIILQVVSCSDEQSRYVNAFEGLLKAAFLENPKIHCQMIKIEHLHLLSETEIAELLQKEGKSHNYGVVSIRYNHLKERFIKEIREIEVKNALPNYRDNGVYVITGGMGGIGLSIANHLAQQHKVRIALMGRSKLNAQKKQALHRLLQQGSEVMYLEADISNPSEVEEAFSRIKNSWGGINGIFHCAGILKDQIIIKKNPEETYDVFSPKMQGTLNIDKLTQHEKLDFWIMFSSGAAITGNIGQGDYASANAWMDLFAIERQQMVDNGKRTGRTITIDWPLWSEGGMSFDESLQQMFYLKSGSLPMPTIEGLQAMDAILANGSTQTIVFYGDAEKIRSQYSKEITAENKTYEESAFISSSTLNENDDIAIIGMSGKYPMASNIEELYRNLKIGRDCITSIPKDRWKDNPLPYNIEDWYNFGGFIDGIDEFDPMFFNISATQAERMDPQARLFLQTAWEACEDAGFPLSRDQHFYPSSSDKSVGVFAGVFWNQYELFSSEMTQRGTPTAFGVASASIANMVSYGLNFHGPSMSIDSMCSSSLTAIHLACESIRRGECHYAVAGGVNLVTHPHKYIFLKQAQFLSSDGKCRSFGKDGDGYVPGEGVGAILLTRLSQAEKEGYHIYGVIKGSAINHVGKTSGATVPDPITQSEVITDAIHKSGIDPRTISYVEAHGTGTALGDPIELRGLELAFNKWSQEKQYCSLGSLKSNMGHLEAAAGIAGVTKILLQFKYRELFPSLHAEDLNPYIPFEDTSFYIQRSNMEWKRPQLQMNGTGTIVPRRAGISSFGANGSNAHIILEEYISEKSSENVVDRTNGGPFVIPLSAKSNESLKNNVKKLVEFLTKDESRSEFSQQRLRDLSYTLQVGREPMNNRIAFIVDTVEVLIKKLELFIKGDQDIEQYFHQDFSKIGLLEETYSENELNERVSYLMNIGSLYEIAQMWVVGSNIDWNQFYGESKPNRMSLPTYSFEKNHYWVPKTEITTSTNPINAAIETTDHPLFLQSIEVYSEAKDDSVIRNDKTQKENCWNFHLKNWKV